ncbi:MAG: hypothetical protein LBG99_01085 [Propionibacteriaceae bacterium]|jgi:hypothetical protein|nr:hypothetical protein [Propionibacteriaceae bacterium]
MSLISNNMKKRLSASLGALSLALTGVVVVIGRFLRRAVVLILCGVFASCTYASTNDPSTDASPGPSGRPAYPVNDKGQTYGSAFGVHMEDEPDLISVEATNGKHGYVYREDLYKGMSDPKSPEEAMALQETKDKQSLEACFESVGLPLPSSLTSDETVTVEMLSALQILWDAYENEGSQSNLEQAFLQLVKASGSDWDQTEFDLAAAAELCVHAAEATHQLVIPVYESDGVTVIGQFMLG